MTQACPYCDKEVKARGAKNHVRLASGDGHGEQGTVPDDFDGAVDTADSGADSPDADDSGDDPEQTEPADSPTDDADSGVQEVTADSLGETQPAQSDSDADGDDSADLPFDPSDDGAIELDGSEELYVHHDGEVKQAPVEQGDWLLITDDGPVLYDPDTNHRYEVVTA